MLPRRGRHRRQLADQGPRPPDRRGPVQAASETTDHIAELIAGRLGSGHRPRQRPPGRVHPPPLRAGRPRAPRGSPRRLRSRHPRGHRLRPAAEPAERPPAHRGAEAGGEHRHPGRGRRRRPRLRRTRRSRSGRSWTPTRPPSAAPGRVGHGRGRRARLEAGGGLTGAEEDRRARHHRRPARLGDHRHRRRRRRDPGGRPTRRRPPRGGRGDRQGPRRRAWSGCRWVPSCCSSPPGWRKWR